MGGSRSRLYRRGSWAVWLFRDTASIGGPLVNLHNSLQEGAEVARIPEQREVFERALSWVTRLQTQVEEVAPL